MTLCWRSSGWCLHPFLSVWQWHSSYNWGVRDNKRWASLLSFNHLVVVLSATLCVPACLGQPPHVQDCNFVSCIMFLTLSLPATSCIWLCHCQQDGWFVWLCPCQLRQFLSAALSARLVAARICQLCRMVLTIYSLCQLPVLVYMSFCYLVFQLMSLSATSNSCLCLGFLQWRPVNISYLYSSSACVSRSSLVSLSKILLINVKHVSLSAPSDTSCSPRSLPATAWCYMCLSATSYSCLCICQLPRVHTKGICQLPRAVACFCQLP